MYDNRRNSSVSPQQQRHRSVAAAKRLVAVPVAQQLANSLKNHRAAHSLNRFMGNKKGAAAWDSPVSAAGAPPLGGAAAMTVPCALGLLCLAGVDEPHGLDVPLDAADGQAQLVVGADHATVALEHLLVMRNVAGQQQVSLERRSNFCFDAAFHSADLLDGNEEGMSAVVSEVATNYLTRDLLPRRGGIDLMNPVLPPAHSVLLLQPSYCPNTADLLSATDHPLLKALARGMFNHAGRRDVPFNAVGLTVLDVPPTELAPPRSHVVDLLAGGQQLPMSRMRRANRVSASARSPHGPSGARVNEYSDAKSLCAGIVDAATRTPQAEDCHRVFLLQLTKGDSLEQQQQQQQENAGEEDDAEGEKGGGGGGGDGTPHFTMTNSSPVSLAIVMLADFSAATIPAEGQSTAEQRTVFGHLQRDRKELLHYLSFAGSITPADAGLGVPATHPHCSNIVSLLEFFCHYKPERSRTACMTLMPSRLDGYSPYEVAGAAAALAFTDGIRRHELEKRVVQAIEMRDVVIQRDERRRMHARGQPRSALDAPKRPWHQEFDQSVKAAMEKTVDGEAALNQSGGSRGSRDNSPKKASISPRKHAAAAAAASPPAAAANRKPALPAAARRPAVPEDKKKQDQHQAAVAAALAPPPRKPRVAVAAAKKPASKSPAAKQSSKQSLSAAAAAAVRKPRPPAKQNAPAAKRPVGKHQVATNKPQQQQPKEKKPSLVDQVREQMERERLIEDRTSSRGSSISSASTPISSVHSIKSAPASEPAVAAATAADVEEPEAALPAPVAAASEPAVSRSVSPSLTPSSQQPSNKSSRHSSPTATEAAPGPRPIDPASNLTEEALAAHNNSSSSNNNALQQQVEGEENLSRGSSAAASSERRRRAFEAAVNRSTPASSSSSRRPSSTAPQQAAPPAAEEPVVTSAADQALTRARFDWPAIYAKLPVERTPEQKAKRMELFNRFDPNGNGYLSLAEIDKGVRDVLALDDLFDAKPVLMRAYMAARDISPKPGRGQDYVEKKEFRMLLVYLFNYMKIWEVFSNADFSGDRRLSKEEFASCYGALQRWAPGMTVDECWAAICPATGRQILFTDFAEWAIDRQLATLVGDNSDDDDETKKEHQETQPVVKPPTNQFQQEDDDDQGYEDDFQEEDLPDDDGGVHSAAAAPPKPAQRDFYYAQEQDGDHNDNSSHRSSRTPSSQRTPSSRRSSPHRTPSPPPPPRSISAESSTDTIAQKEAAAAAAAEAEAAAAAEEQEDTSRLSSVAEVVDGLKNLKSRNAEKMEKSQIGSPTDADLSNLDVLKSGTAAFKCELAATIQRCAVGCDNGQIQLENATDDDVVELGQEVFEHLLTEGDHTPGNSNLVGAMLDHLRDALRLTQLAVDKGFLSVAAFDGNLDFLRLFFETAFPPALGGSFDELDFVDIFHNGMFSQSRRIPVTRYLIQILNANKSKLHTVVEEAANKSKLHTVVEETADALREFFNDICSQKKLIPKEDQSGRMELIEEMLQDVVVAPVLDSQTVFSRAAQEGDVELMKLLLKNCPARIDINRVSADDKMTALIHAVLANSADAVLFLLSLDGIDISHKSDEGDALFLAEGLRRDDKIVQALREKQQQQQQPSTTGGLPDVSDDGTEELQRNEENNAAEGTERLHRRRSGSPTVGAVSRRDSDSMTDPALGERQQEEEQPTSVGRKELPEGPAVLVEQGSVDVVKLPAIRDSAAVERKLGGGGVYIGDIAAEDEDEEENGGIGGRAIEHEMLDSPNIE